MAFEAVHDYNLAYTALHNTSAALTDYSRMAWRRRMAVDFDRATDIPSEGVY